MTSRGSAAGAMALAALIVACGVGGGDTNGVIINATGGNANATGGDTNGVIINATGGNANATGGNATDGTPKLLDDGGLNDGSGGTVDVGGGIAPISETDLETLRSGECSDWNATSTALPASLMLVVDVSSSMKQRPDAAGRRTKWDITREALVAALNVLPPETQVGLLLYPNMEATYGDTAQDAFACVNIQELVAPAALGDGAQGHRQALIDTLEAATLSRSTPTHDALATALAAFAQAGLTSNGFVLLITDGQPTLSRGCVSVDDNLTDVDPYPIMLDTRAAFNQGILTYVIGSPGSEDAREWLSRTAQAGGTAPTDCSDTGPKYCHFDMTTQADFSAALNEALAQIAGFVISCSYPIPEPPTGSTIDPNKVNLVYTTDTDASVLLLRNDQPNCDVGWQYTVDGTGINLCSATCNSASQQRSAKVELFFGCDTKVR